MCQGPQKRQGKWNEVKEEAKKETQDVMSVKQLPVYKA
jgi:hypothetical protein